MRRLSIILAFLALSAFLCSVRAAVGLSFETPSSLPFAEGELVLRGSDARRQLLVTETTAKGGCNGGGCHGKAAGQNGFRLSLLGFEPGEDYDHLVNESRGRRIFPAAPERSLLLLKATGEIPHGGGKRIDTDSDDYRLLVRW